MVHKLQKQLQDLGIRQEPARDRQIRDRLRRIECYRNQLWQQQSYAQLVQFVRETISAELSRKLEHIITPPKAVGLAEEISLDSIKWLVEYWWRADKDYSPDLYRASDNTVVASWQVGDSTIQVRFLSSGFALAAVKRQQQGQSHKLHFQMPVWELPTSLV
ncbi:MAG: hypothetical protein ACLFMQ_06465 [Desulfohalobiaceae bacterium]